MRWVRNLLSGTSENFFQKKFGKKEKVVIFAARFEMNREDH